MTENISDAKKRANEKWNQNNKERMNYLRSRSSAKSFIRNKATIDDIKELREMLDERENELN